MRTLVVNAGSSSLKLAVVDRSGSVEDRMTIERWTGADHIDVIETYVAACGIVDAVGHRVVHGGPRYRSAARVDRELLDYLATIADLAPLHTQRAVDGIEAIEQLLPHVPAVAAFDTSAFVTLPVAASTYAMPREWNQRFGLRRYGFHGLSHTYALRRGAEIAGRDPAEVRALTCHLGAGCSLTAHQNGVPVDTTMGFTPLAGLVMQTRPGSVDPGLVLWLQRHGGIDVDTLSDALEHRSGLYGLSGTSGDLREVMAGAESGDQDCQLALDVYLHRITREAGAMAASSGGLDLLVFTGGVGEHAPTVRSSVVSRLRHLGVALDHASNAATGFDGDITGQGSRASTVVVTAGEEIEIAHQTRALVESDRGN